MLSHRTIPTEFSEKELLLLGACVRIVGHTMSAVQVRDAIIRFRNEGDGKYIDLLQGGSDFDITLRDFERLADTCHSLAETEPVTDFGKNLTPGK